MLSALAKHLCPGSGGMVQPDPSCSPPPVVMLSALAKHLCPGEGGMVQHDRPISQDAVNGESISSVFSDICKRESILT